VQPPLARALPLDIFAIKEIGVDAWTNDYRWHMAESQYFAFLDTVWRAFDEVYAGLTDQSSRDVLLSDTAFLNFLSAHCYVRGADAAARRMGCTASAGALASRLLEPDRAGQRGAFAPAGADRSMVSLRMRQVAASLRHSPLAGWADALCPDRAAAWSLGSFSQLKALYAKRHALACSHVYLPVLLGRRAGGEAALPHETVPAVRSVLRAVSKAAETHLGTNIEEDVGATSWFARLARLAETYAALRDRRHVPRVLLLSVVAKPFHKIAALGLRRRGTHVVGFHHGNDMGNLEGMRSGYFEYAHCDTFVCPTAAAASLRRSAYEREPISAFAPVTFTAVDTMRYVELARAAERFAPPRRVKRVMIMGYPMGVMRYPTVADFFIFQLDVELRLAAWLRRNGYHTIYKMHPEHQVEARGVFESRVDEISTRPFEKVWRGADAFIFGCTTSTTFGFALTTNRPVIVLNIAGLRWTPESFRLLERRCHMIDSYVDEANRLQFDEAALGAALAGEVEAPDPGYLDALMSPGARPGAPAAAPSAR